MSIKSRPSKSNRKPIKSDSESVFTPALQELLTNKPDPTETAAPVIQAWINSGWTFFRRGEHDAFLVAWHVGEVLSAVRKSCPHGNSKNKTKPTWPEWVSKFTPFDCIETANRWADIFEIVKPETVTNYNAMTIESARKLVELFKAEQGRNDERNNGKGKGKGKGESETDSDESDAPPKNPPPLGNVINAVRNAAGKLALSLEFHGTYSSHQSPLRDGDKIKSWINDNLLSAAEILAGTETLNNHLKSLLGSRHKTTTEGAKILRDLNTQFAKARAEYGKLTVKGDA